MTDHHPEGTDRSCCSTRVPSGPATATTGQTASALETELGHKPSTPDEKAEAKADRTAFHAAMKAARHLKARLAGTSPAA